VVNEPVFLIGTSRLLWEGLRRIFSESSLTVLHESRSVEDALPFIESLQPSLVLIDLPDSGEALTMRVGQIRTAAQSARIVVLTETIGVSRLVDAFSAGVDGYLLKNMSGDALHQSLRLVLLGEKVFPSDLAELLTNRQVMSWRDTGQVGNSHGLSDREMQILACLINGAQNKQIASELKISDGTVRVRIKAILKKVHVQNRTQAAIWALNHGIARDVKG
jgi:two-component system nitrate/nitrite response regulator NarL